MTSMCVNRPRKILLSTTAPVAKCRRWQTQRAEIKIGQIISPGKELKEERPGRTRKEGHQSTASTATTEITKAYDNCFQPPQTDGADNMK